MRLVKNHLNLEMVKGDTLAFGLKIYKLGQIPDYLGFVCAKNYDDEGYVFKSELDDGITFAKQNEDGDYYFKVRVDPEKTLQLEHGKYYYEMILGVNGDKYTILKGILTLEYNLCTY